MRIQPSLALCASLSWFIIQTLLIAADALSASQQSKLDEMLKQVQAIAADPIIVSAVKQQNASPDPKFVSMTQDQWKGLSVLDPTVRGFTKNQAADVLKARRTEMISEAFVSAADGTKTAFLSKTSNWCHKGKPKHDVPMSGKHWQGQVELDESTGLQQIQVSVPILDAGNPIGSLVVGISVSKLTNP